MFIKWIIWKYTTPVSQFTANETVSWSLNGGADAAKFQIDSNGNLSFQAAPDYESPSDQGDTAGNNTYVVIVRATDNAGNTADQTVTITVTDVDEEIIASPIDISDDTDSGADDKLTSNGNPVISFTGEPGLTISLNSPDGQPVPSAAYTVVQSTTAGVSTYTVTLKDADKTTAGNQPFGDFFAGTATNNPANTGDGTYTIKATDGAGNSADVGSFDIDTNAPDGDQDGADDAFEGSIDPATGESFDKNKDGIPDVNQRTIATTKGSDGNAISIEARQQASQEKNEDTGDGSLKTQTSLLYQGRAESAAQRTSTGTNQPQVIIDLDESIASDPNNVSLPNNGKMVLATTDQPKFRLIPEIIKTGTVDAQAEADFTNAATKKFKSATHEVEIYFNENESNNWNALFKPDKNGNYYFFGYNSDTGLGGILLDRNNNGLIDGAALYLRDNQTGDLNPDDYVIDDPVGLASIAEAPSLTINAAGNGLTVNGAAGTGLWLELQTTASNANWQNSLTLHSSIRQAVKSIGATSQSNNLGKLEIYVQAGEEITFQQDSNQTNHASTPKLSIASSSNGVSLKLEDSKDNDYNDLIIDIKSKLTASSEADIRIANLQRNTHDSLFDFSWIESTGAKVQLDITSDCGYKNQLGLVRLDIDPVTGEHYDDYRVNGISSDNLLVFHKEIIDNLISPTGDKIIATSKSSQSIIWEMDGSEAGIYAPVLITEKGDVLTAGLNTSSDGARHTKQFGLNHIGFEDTMASANPDWDFNDVTFKALLLTS